MTATDTKSVADIPVADIPDDKLNEEHERLVNMLFRQGRWCGACRVVYQSAPMPPSTEDVLRQRAAAKAAGGSP